MAPSFFDDLDRARFDWPEPYVVDLLSEHYASHLTGAAARSLVRQHQVVLRATLEKSPADAARLRDQLATSARAMGLDPAVMARVEAAVVRELTHIVDTRFRHSPRLRDAHVDRLRRLVTAVSVPAVVPPRARAPRFGRAALAV